MSQSKQLLVFFGVMFFFYAVGEIAKFVEMAFTFFILPITGLVFLYFIIRGIYFLINPKAKRAYLERKAQKVEKFEEERKKALEATAQKAEEERKKALERKTQSELHRDSDQQVTPYTYQIGKHGNESLAIRYGIANQERRVKEYWYHAKGGVRKRNSERDHFFYEPARTITLQKTKKVGNDRYEVLLTDFRNRRAIAIIEFGTEYVKTFYPLDDGWFVKHANLEATLKGNNSFSLKELATFHVQKTVGF